MENDKGRVLPAYLHERTYVDRLLDTYILWYPTADGNEVFRDY